jgi:hypothetical protein
MTTVYESAKETADGLGRKAGIALGLMTLIATCIVRGDVPELWEWIVLVAIGWIGYEAASFVLLAYYVHEYNDLYRLALVGQQPQAAPPPVVGRERSPEPTQPRSNAAETRVSLVRRAAGEWAERTDWDGLVGFLQVHDQPPFSRSTLRPYVDQRFYSLRESDGGNTMSFPQLMVAIKAATAVSNENGQTNYQWTSDAATILAGLVAEL